MAFIYDRNAKKIAAAKELGQKLPPHRYVISYRDERGKWTERSAGSSYRAARTLLNQIQLQITAGGDKQQKPVAVSFIELCDRFFASREPQIRPSTLDDYKSTAKNYMLPYFSGMDANSITPMAVQDFLAYLNGKSIKPATAAKVYRNLKVIIRFAVSMGYIQQDPCRTVRGPRVHRAQVNYLTRDEVESMLAAADNQDTLAILAVACYAGLRQGEIFALTWGDVLFEKRRISVNKAYKPGYGNSAPKSQAGTRHVPLVPQLARILEGLKAGRGDTEPAQLVFPSKAGGPRNKSNFYRDEFKRTIVAAGIERKVRFHDLRHTFASLCLDAGVDLKTLQTVMGHANIATTCDVYGHLYPDAYERLSRKLSLSLEQDSVVVPLHASQDCG